MAESGSGTAARELDSVGSAGRLGTTLGGRRWRALSRRLPLIYGVGLLVLALLALLGTYEPPDADLWYHLAHGRYITETGDIPTTSYFSYQEPEREWVDYYWLFQVVVYSAWRVGGPGLVLALRAVVCLGFLVLLWRFLAADGRAARSPLWIGVLLGLATCAVWSRLTLFRPHTFSYLALLGFLVLFEGPERRRWWLIPLTVLWMNLHGIYYPVVLLIVAAYGAEWLMRRLRDRAEPAGLVTPLCSLGVLVAIFATPHGRALSGVPFVSTTQASRFVEELGRLPWEVWRTYFFRGFAPVEPTATMILLLLAIVGVAALAWSRRLRVAHLLLALGGTLLLMRSARFTAELSILVLPLLRDLGPLTGLDRLWHRRRPAGVLLALLALAPAYARLARDVDLELGAPAISQRDAPRGPAELIGRLDVEGRVMNWPDDGGYLVWALPPRNPIFMDMEIPFLFRDEDWTEIASAFFTEHGLRAFLQRHRPAFIVSPLEREELRRSLDRDHPDYRLVYFDERRAVWADRRLLPEKVAAWEIDLADPSSLREADLKQLGAERRGRLRRDLERLAGIAGGSAVVSGTLARLDLLEGDPHAALERAAAAARRFPRDAWLAEIEAAAWSAGGHHAAAAEALERALVLAGGESLARPRLLLALADALGALERWDEAYLAGAEAMERIGPTAPPQDLLELAETALRAGRAGDARNLLDSVDRLLPSGDARRARLDMLRARLPAG